jgi:ribulose 1,5-bisphosphate synthetase/thiazole synthase
MITRRNFLKITAAGSAMITAGNASGAKATLQSALPDMNYARESARQIPVIADADLVVIGGSSRAVALAATAAKTGISVFIATSLPYLGDDICGSFLYERLDGEKPLDPLARKLFPTAAMPSPMHVKSTLENELIDFGVDFLYSSFATEILTDEKGAIAGVVITNRSGRQAIRARSIVDCTHTASVAAMAGAEFTSFAAGNQQFRFTAVGNKLKEISGIKAVVMPKPVVFGGKEWPMITYTYNYMLKDNSYSSLMQAEQYIRSLVWDADQVDSSDLLWYIPSQFVRTDGYVDAFTTVRNLPLQAFSPKNVNNLWVLSPSAGLSRETAAIAMRPINALYLGALLGEEIAYMIKDIPAPGKPKVKQFVINANNYGASGEILRPLRKANHNGYVESPEGALPVLGEYDIVVLGGGTAGSTAGIAAAQQGVKTLMLEYLHGLGGLGTLGMIGRYWDGYREGYTTVLDNGVRNMAPLDHPRQRKDWQEESVADWKMEWLRREYLNAGGELWFGVIGCGALTENGQVKGLVISTPSGRGAILAKTIIDSTGSADIAIAAGAGYEYTGGKTLAVQGAGTGHINPGNNYNNNDWLFVDDTDVLDISRAYIQGKIKAKGQYDLVKLPQTRERRRIIAEHTVSVTDVLSHRRYADTISFHRSSFDTHGMVVDPYFLLSPPMERHTIYDADVPLRSLLPKGLEGIIVTGLGAGAHRDAMPVIRMRSCLQTQGYSVGYLAAQAVKEGLPLRKLNIKRIQKHLVSIGNLPARVLTDKDFKGFSIKELQSAANSVTDNYKGLEILLSDPVRSMPPLRNCLKTDTNPAHALVYASVLCMMGDAEYANIVADTIRKHSLWDKGWDYTGMGQFGMSLSPLDALLMSLGAAHNKAYLPAVLEKAVLLKPEDAFSHYRAVAYTSENLSDQAAAPVLAALLCAPGLRGQSIITYAEARRSTVPGMEDTSVRNLALKELHLAGALYKCGDKDGIAKEILLRYAKGLQGHYARYAEETLSL